MTDPNSSMPVRTHPAHGVKYSEGQPTIVFDTVCTKDRNAWLANDDVHELLRHVWVDASGWLVGRYIIIPDHIHLFAVQGKIEIEFKDRVKYWKSQFTTRHKIAGHRWQTDDWDTRMRTGQQYEEKWQYVRLNAVRHGLVESPENWPYQGSLHELRWEQW